MGHHCNLLLISLYGSFYRNAICAQLEPNLDMSFCHTVTRNSSSKIGTCGVLFSFVSDCLCKYSFSSAHMNPFRLLQHNTSDGHAPQFTQVFTITFFGAIVVTANIKLLGGKMFISFLIYITNILLDHFSNLYASLDIVCYLRWSRLSSAPPSSIRKSSTSDCCSPVSVSAGQHMVSLSLDLHKTFL